MGFTPTTYELNLARMMYNAWREKVGKMQSQGKNPGHAMAELARARARLMRAIKDTEKVLYGAPRKRNRSWRVVAWRR